MKKGFFRNKECEILQRWMGQSLINLQRKLSIKDFNLFL